MPYIQRDNDGNIIAITGVSTDEYVDGPVELYVPLTQHKTKALAQLRSAVSAARQKYATPETAYQSMIYDQKRIDAQAYIAAGRPSDASAYPILAASAAGQGRSVSAEADAVIASAAAWIQIGAATEQLRQAGQNAINAATTQADVETARDAYVGQLRAI